MPGVIGRVRPLTTVHRHECLFCAKDYRCVTIHEDQIRRVGGRCCDTCRVENQRDMAVLEAARLKVVA